MNKCLFLGDSITDADHLFDPAGLGHGYVNTIASKLPGCILTNKGQNGFTVEQLKRMLFRDSFPINQDVITILVGINDIPVEVYTSHNRIPDEFYTCYNDILSFIRKKYEKNIILVEPFLFDHPEEMKPWHKYIHIESRIIRSLSHKYNCYFLPTDELLRKEASIWGINSITIDGIHLTSRGNDILADLWLSAYHYLFS